MEPSVTRSVVELRDWTKNVKEVDGDSTNELAAIDPATSD
jgi:hypothetical protein